jgi:hypothetical protein
MVTRASSAEVTSRATTSLTRQPLPAQTDTMTAPQPVPSATTTAMPTTGLEADFAALQATIGAPIGIVVAPVGGGGAPIMLGDWQIGPAWSTSKVPVAIAALREGSSADLVAQVNDAITVSDNAAAEAIWARLGDPYTAAAKVEAVLREAGDPTQVQAERVRPDFTAFGQTRWPLSEQARFMAFVVCDRRDEQVLSLMARVSSDQGWGLGTIPGARFKGGWGPSTSGAYLVRQIGVFGSGDAMTAVAIAAEPASGAFGDGTADLTAIAQWLSERSGELPAGGCGG